MLIAERSSRARRHLVLPSVCGSPVTEPARYSVIWSRNPEVSSRPGAEAPGERPPTFGEVQTTDGQVQVRTSPRHATVDVEPGDRALSSGRST